MECNKEEAFSALQVAEKKLQANDFMGARKMAQLAQRLHPELQNVNQLLAIAEVLCSAENKISGVKYDLYGILQTQRTSDQKTIRKQYRKLALLVHPDKNKFAGAEAAFKLVGEANSLLRDKSKRSLYDTELSLSQKNDSHQLPRQPSKAKKPTNTQPSSKAKEPTNKQKKASNSSQNASHYSQEDFIDFLVSNKAKEPTNKQKKASNSSQKASHYSQEDFIDFLVSIISKNSSQNASHHSKDDDFIDFLKFFTSFFMFTVFGFVVINKIFKI